MDRILHSLYPPPLQKASQEQIGLILSPMQGQGNLGTRLDGQRYSVSSMVSSVAISR